MQSTITLRPAELGDAENLLSWRNDPVTRRASFNTAPVPEQVHMQWLADRLADPSCRLWIAMLERVPVGQVRVQRNDCDVAEISVGVAPEHRGKGYSLQIVAEAQRRMRAEGFATQLVARVKPDNAASLAVFEKCGFMALRRETDAVVLVARPSPT